MPCQDCAGVRVELLSLKEFIGQWFNILIGKVDNLESQNKEISERINLQYQSQSPNSAIYNVAHSPLGNDRQSRTCRQSNHKNSKSNDYSSGDTGDPEGNGPPLPPLSRYQAAVPSSSAHISTESLVPPPSTSLLSGRSNRNKMSSRSLSKSINRLTRGVTSHHPLSSTSTTHNSNSDHHSINGDDAPSATALTVTNNADEDFPVLSLDQIRSLSEHDGGGTSSSSPENVKLEPDENGTNNTEQHEEFDQFENELLAEGSGGIAMEEEDEEPSTSNNTTAGNSQSSSGIRTLPASVFVILKRNQSGEKIFVCRICNTHFSQRSNVKRHINVIHQKNTEHPCRYCGKVFAWKGAWRRHERRVHERLYDNSPTLVGRDLTL